MFSGRIRTSLSRLMEHVESQPSPGTARISPCASSVPESVVNASSLVFQGWADDFN
jgi:hypothetical protein